MGSGASTHPGDLPEDQHPKKRCFGELCGVGPGNVPAYSCCYSKGGIWHIHKMSAYHEGEYTGFKWQCVEYSRRWLLINHSVTYDSVGYAYQIFDLEHFVRLVPKLSPAPAEPKDDGKKVDEGCCCTDDKKKKDEKVKEKLPIVRVKNGTVVPKDGELRLGSVLLWLPQGHFATTGHVAIVTEVTPAGKVRIAEQNVLMDAWEEGNNYARELLVTVDADTGCTTVEEEMFPSGTVLGWVNPILPPPSS